MISAADGEGDRVICNRRNQDLVRADANDRVDRACDQFRITIRG